MGDVNQKLYLQHFVKNVEGAILEIGSKDYGNTQNFRELFPNNEYVGVDLSEGKGVDLVLDLTKTVGSLRKEYFSLIICCSVLEHTPVPWIMAQNMDSLLRGGELYIFQCLGFGVIILTQMIIFAFQQEELCHYFPIINGLPTIGLLISLGNFFPLTLVRTTLIVN